MSTIPPITQALPKRRSKAGRWQPRRHPEYEMMKTGDDLPERAVKRQTPGKRRWVRWLVLGAVAVVTIPALAIGAWLLLIFLALEQRRQEFPDESVLADISASELEARYGDCAPVADAFVRKIENVRTNGIATDGPSGEAAEIAIAAYLTPIPAACYPAVLARTNPDYYRADPKGSYFDWMYTDTFKFKFRLQADGRVEEVLVRSPYKGL